jgi:hypothetical protein
LSLEVHPTGPETGRPGGSTSAIGSRRRAAVIASPVPSPEGAGVQFGLEGGPAGHHGHPGVPAAPDASHSAFFGSSFMIVLFLCVSVVSRHWLSYSS